MRHLHVWSSANVPTADENANAQPRSKPVERAVTFRDPEGLGSVRKAFGGADSTALECSAPAVPTSPPRPPRTPRLLYMRPHLRTF